MRYRSVQVLLSISAFAALGTMLANAQSAPSGPANSQAGAPKTTEQTFKNIQLLKGLPADQLIPAMQFITSSLGVECSFCHVENHFDQDDKKPKQIARKMMQMMTTINQQNFDSHRMVTCNTCHRGSLRLVSTPVISEEPKPPAPQAVDDEDHLPPNLPSPDQLIEKYVQALGGVSAIQKISTRVEKGTADFAGHEISVEVFDEAPAQRATVIHLPIGDNVTAFDGKQGWTAAPGHPVREMPAADIEGAKMDADLQFPLHLKQAFEELRTGRPEKIGERETYQLIALTNQQPRLRLYFDQQSGLLVRMLRYSDSPLGWNPIRLDYADYRAVDGVQVPYRWTVARPAGQFTIQATEVRQNTPIVQGAFVRPIEPVQPNAH